MIQQEIMRALGALQTSVLALHTRLNDARAATHRELELVRRELHGRLARLERAQPGASKRLWLQIAGLAMVAGSSLVGLISPERAAGLLKALLH